MTDWQPGSPHHRYPQYVGWTRGDPYASFFVPEDYKPQGIILGGGFGAVFKVVLKEFVDEKPAVLATKTLKLDLNGGNAYLNRRLATSFLREAFILAGVVHTNIVAFEDMYAVDPLFQTPRSLYFRMEWLDCSLREALYEKDAPYRVDTHDRRLKAWKELLSAVVFLHANRIMHRDIKPDNCGFKKDEKGDCRLKLMDMGLGRDVPEPDESGKPKTTVSPGVGTLQYKAPEVLEGREDYNEKADLYSVGVLMAEMVRGQRPVSKGNPARQLRHIVTTREDLHLDLPLDRFPDEATRQVAIDLIKKLLALDPADRFSAAQALEHDLLRNVPLGYTPEGRFWGNLDDITGFLTLEHCIERINGLLEQHAPRIGGNSQPAYVPSPSLSSLGY